MGTSELNRDATYQEIAQMKYLDLYIKEAQRVYPSVPFIGRYTDKDYEIGRITCYINYLSVFYTKQTVLQTENLCPRAPPWI